MRIRQTFRLCTVLGFALGFSIGHPAGSFAGKSHFRPCASGDTPEFPHYYLGESFEGLPVTDREYTCTEPEPGYFARVHDMSYIYDDCEPLQGCARTVEVQTWPACDRSRMLYTLAPDPTTGRPIHYHRSSGRGVPGIYVIETEAGHVRIELYTGDVTIVVFGDSLDEARRAVAALQSAPTSSPVVAAGDELAPPVRGHLVGKLNCGFRLRGPAREAGAFCVGGSRCAKPGVVLKLTSPRRGFASGQLQHRRTGSRGRFKPWSSIQFPLQRGRVAYRFRRAGLGERLIRGEYRLLLGATNKNGRRARTRATTFAVR